jgi:hypothetical protein
MQHRMLDSESLELGLYQLRPNSASDFLRIRGQEWAVLSCRIWGVRVRELRTRHHASFASPFRVDTGSDSDQHRSGSTPTPVPDPHRPRSDCSLSHWRWLGSHWRTGSVLIGARARFSLATGSILIGARRRWHWHSPVSIGAFPPFPLGASTGRLPFTHPRRLLSALAPFPSILITDPHPSRSLCGSGSRSAASPIPIGRIPDPDRARPQSQSRSCPQSRSRPQSQSCPPIPIRPPPPIAAPALGSRLWS